MHRATRFQLAVEQVELLIVEWREDMEKTRVLVVDDEPRIVELLVDCLAHRGFDAMGSTRTQDAVHLLSSWNPDIVVTDVCMPCGGATALIEATAGMETRPAMVLMTGSEFELAKDLIRTGAVDAAIDKPFLVPELTDIIVRIASRHEPLGLAPVVKSDVGPSCGQPTTRGQREAS